MKKKLTATTPDGGTVTRTTEADYTHVVVIECDRAADYARLENEIAREIADAEHLNGLLDGSIEPTPYQASQSSCWARNATLSAKRAVKDADKLAKMEKTGTYWATWSWHTRKDLAEKSMSAARSRTTRPFRVVEVNR